MSQALKPPFRLTVGDGWPLLTVAGGWVLGWVFFIVGQQVFNNTSFDWGGLQGIFGFVLGTYLVPAVK